MSKMKQRMSNLVYGYIYSFMLIETDNFEHIINIVTSFCGHILLRFDMFHSKYQNCIYDNTVLRRPTEWHNVPWDQFSVCSSYFFNKGINEFWIQCIKPDEDSIGITTNTMMSTEVNNWYGYYHGNTYCYTGDGTISCTSKTINRKHIPFQYGLKGFKKNDIIKVSIDCRKWTLRFSNNDEKIGKRIKIVPNMTYHLFVHTSFHNTEYKLLL
eukprot:49457_1